MSRPIDKPEHKSSNNGKKSLWDVASQQQFLEVVDPAEAARRVAKRVRLEPLGKELVPLDQALYRVLAENIVSPVDVPAFDRSNVDGFAVRAADTFGATEETPRVLRLNPEVICPGRAAEQPVSAGTATTIATGAPLPRGADAVVMVEFTELSRSEKTAAPPNASAEDNALQELTVEIFRPVAPGENITFAGSDIGAGETVLHWGQLLTSREIGVLAAVGLAEVPVFRQPSVAIVSTGDELTPPGQPLPQAGVYDSNAHMLAAAVRELACRPVLLGIAKDDETDLRKRLERGLECDVVLLSGGTSKGAGDVAYQVVQQMPGVEVLAHGVALKPGKPVCLAVFQGKLLAVLPGFPTSAMFTFHEFVAPVLRRLAGLPPSRTEQVNASLPVRVNSQKGRKEFVLVNLIPKEESLTAYPIGKGSGSVTAFSFADGFFSVDQHQELLEAGKSVNVQLLDARLTPADLIVIGSHCVGLDLLLSAVREQGFTVKTLFVGSTGGLRAAQREECDVAGVHLFDPTTGTYNRPFLTPGLRLVRGYGRMQGLVFRPGDTRFEHRSLNEALTHAVTDPDCLMVNRNPGSGTRLLIDRLLQGAEPPGYALQVRSHNAVVAAVAQKRADWGVAIDVVARAAGLSFLPIQQECYDFVIPERRWNRPAVQAFLTALKNPTVQQQLKAKGFLPPCHDHKS